MRVMEFCGEAGLETTPEHIFVERLVAPQRLFVLGAGDDAKPLVRMAALLGWNITVLDGRAQLARTERFPEAAQVCAGSDASAEVLSDSAQMMLWF